MPKYYCDYCDTYLTHDSPSVRKTHCNGRKHKDNVKIYYVLWMEKKAQSIIDATTAAFKSAKLQPFSTGVKPPPGVMIPPPPSLQGPHQVAPGPVMGPPPMAPMAAPMRGPMPVMGPPAPGMMMPGMRPVAMMQIAPLGGPMRAPMM